MEAFIKSFVEVLFKALMRIFKRCIFYDYFGSQVAPWDISFPLAKEQGF